ncbi:MAG: cysteine--tRNA ligase [Nitrososphaeria archaeon]
MENTIMVYNTLTRKKEALKPLEDNIVRMYVCGVTVYDSTHIGHARTYVSFDIIKRYLLYRGYRVFHVQNFTDVDDKIINRASMLNIPTKELAERYIKDFMEVSEALNLLPADHYPRATEYVPKMIEFIERLIEKGYAYVTETGVYFDVSKFNEYGKLSHYSIEQLQAGARVEIDPTKRNPLDFALWKFFKNEPKWKSPWGEGRPGWHIECSTMALVELKETLDIHGGGSDLIFPHHENEIAQSEALTGKPFAKIWMHTGLLTVKGERMGKSLGNFIPVREMINRVGPNALRLMFIGSHYRSPLDFDDNAVKNAIDNLKLIESAFAELNFFNQHESNFVDEVKNFCSSIIEEFERAMDDDFKTPIALAVFMKLVKEIHKYAAEGKLNKENSKIFKETFEKISYVFGLKFASISEEEAKIIEELVRKRNEFRKSRNFKEADAIREKLKENDIELIDYPDKTIWYKKYMVKLN